MSKRKRHLVEATRNLEELTGEVWCHHCHRYHQQKECVRVVIKGRRQWRCRHSINEAKKAKAAQSARQGG